MNQFLKLLVITSALTLTSCCYFPNFLDGEAIQSCKSRNKAIYVCKPHSGLKEFYAIWAECNDGSKYNSIYDTWEYK